MLYFKLGDTSIEMPENYGELTHDQFIELKNNSDPDDDLGVFSILSQQPRELWEQCSDIDIDGLLMPNIKFLSKEFNPVFLLPDKINIEGKYYSLPGGIGVNTYGQKNHLQREVRKIEKSGKDELELYPFVVALYFQPAVTGMAYNANEVNKLIPVIKKCRIDQVWPIATFFLTNYVKYATKKASDLHTLPNLRRLGQESISLTSSENYRHFSLLKRFWAKRLKIFS